MELRFAISMDGQIQLRPDSSVDGLIQLRPDSSVDDLIQPGSGFCAGAINSCEEFSQGRCLGRF